MALLAIIIYYESIILELKGRFSSETIKKKSKRKFRLLMNKRKYHLRDSCHFILSLNYTIRYLQIVKGAEYKRTIDSTESITVNESVPRGPV